jgi:uncharacterized membrane protein YgdD (TMEM256/DUF423 family)
MKRDYLRIYAAFSAACAIVMGAMAAHWVHGVAQEWLKLGAQYQLVHAVAALVLAERARISAWILLVGASLFAFSLDALAFNIFLKAHIIVPIGGAAMIAGWLCLLFKEVFYISKRD